MDRGVLRGELMKLIDDYMAMLKKGLDSINEMEFVKTVDRLRQAHRLGRTVFTAGNGGSAAIAEHFSCDHSKGVATNTDHFPKLISLPSNMSLMTAIANDCGYDEVFSHQINLHGERGDVLVVVSSSGNSPNIVKAAQAAYDVGMDVIAFTGFDGGDVLNYANFKFHIPIKNYGVVEDCHQILAHMMAQHIRTLDTVVPMDRVKL
ncbi:SIS domain-containing protein [bacterium]|nr:SIS domain-containing protein [bacterium]